MKTYPLEIEHLYEADDGPLMGYYSKGHHDPYRFLLELWEEEDVERDHLMVYPPGRFAVCSDVLHVYWRKVPCDVDGGFLFIPARKMGHGAFPATVIEARRRRWSRELRRDFQDWRRP